MNEFKKLTAAEYHKDPDGPRLSNSIAKILLNLSPAHAYAAHPQLGGTRHFTPTRAMEEGTTLHALLLEDGAPIVEIPYADYRSDAARNAKAIALKSNLVPVLRDDLERLRYVAAKLAPQLPFLSSPRDVEKVAYWESAGARCRGMLDVHQGREIHDLKKASSARPDDLAKRMIDFGYDTQAAAYIEAVELITGEPVDAFTFWFVEAEAPFAVYPVRVEPGDEWHSLGVMKWERAKATWAACIDAGFWPCYETKKVLPPSWAYTLEGTP